MSGLWSLAQIPGRGLVVFLHHDRLSPYRPVTPGVNGEWGGVGQYPTRWKDVTSAKGGVGFINTCTEELTSVGYIVLFSIVL